MKKFISYLMVMAAFVVGATEAMAQSVTIGGITYTVSQGEAVASAADSTIVAVDMLSSVTIDGAEYSVTGVADRGFKSCGVITSVVIPQGVTTIGDAAFIGCSSLTSVVLPQSVAAIGDWAFAGCSSLASVTLPDTMAHIGRLAFSGCSSLTSVVLPEGIPAVSYGLFSGCPVLTSVTVPSSVASIGELAFYNCVSLTAITLPQAVTSVGARAFDGCSSLTSFTSYCELPSTSFSDFFGDTEFAEDCTLLIYQRYEDEYSDWLSHFAEVKVFIATVTYLVDGEEYTTVEYACGDPLTLIAAPTKEGYLFSGWSQTPQLMPLEDITVEGTFIRNTFTITYIVRGEVYHTETVTFGDSITPPAPPVDPTDGMVIFSGWIGLPETMPAHDITVIGDGYRLTYKLNGDIYNDTIYSYGSPITPLPEPVKEGYSFSGWSRIPTTMPEYDVTVTGSLTINTYTLTYKVDGRVVHTEALVYGTAITPLAEPVEVGRIFSGWSDIPTTMPAGDVTVTGSFTTDIYKVIYIVDGEVYRTDSVTYGMGVIPADVPVKEGHTFSGWSEIPRLMPAADVTVTGSFTVNTYELTYIVDGELYHTDSLDYGTPIPPIEQPVKEGYILTGWNNIPVTMPAEDVAIIGLFVLADRHADEQGLIFEINDTKDAFEVSGYTEDLVRDVVIPTTFLGLPVNAISPRALAFTIDMQSLVIPSSIKSVGENSLGGNETLLTIEWNTTAPVDAECFSRPSNYGNMLVYVADATTEVTFQGNVVVDGQIDRLDLIEGYPFRNTRPFTARHITFTRTFSTKTTLGVSGGWEALVLPFDVQRVESNDKGELKPFGEADFVTSLPYWLGLLQPDGTFATAHDIVANRPFIMQVPNSDDYEDRYRVYGEVIFSAWDVTVQPTTEVEQPQSEGYSMLGSYEGTPASDIIYALNDEEYTAEGNVHLPNAIFVADSRDIRPFEAYIYNGSAARAPHLLIGDRKVTAIEPLLPTMHADDAWYTLQGIRLSGHPQAPGLYIHNRKVVAIRAH